MTYWQALLLAMTHVATFAAGVWISALVSSGRIIPRRSYQAVIPKRPDEVTPAQVDMLTQAALMNPKFDQTVYVDDPRKIPPVSHKPYELVPPGFSGIFQTGGGKNEPRRPVGGGSKEGAGAGAGGGAKAGAGPKAP